MILLWMAYIVVERWWQKWTLPKYVQSMRPCGVSWLERNFWFAPCTDALSSEWLTQGDFETLVSSGTHHYVASGFGPTGEMIHILYLTYQERASGEFRLIWTLSEF